MQRVGIEPTLVVKADDVVRADGLGVLQHLVSTRPTHGEGGHVASSGFLVAKGCFEGELVVGAHDHLDAAHVNSIARDGDARVGVRNLLDKDDDFWHLSTCVLRHRCGAQEGCLKPSRPFLRGGLQGRD